MSVLSIRSLPKELDRSIRKEAKRQRKTKTEVVIEALEYTFGFSPAEQKRKKVRSFFGNMKKGDYKDFKKATRHFSKIDAELWK